MHMDCSIMYVCCTSGAPVIRFDNAKSFLVINYATPIGSFSVVSLEYYEEVMEADISFFNHINLFVTNPSNTS